MRYFASEKHLPAGPGMIVVMLIWLAGCQSVEQAQVQYDAGADYSNVHTFTWITDRPLGFHRIDPGTTVNPALEASLKKNTREYLEQKGFRFVDTLDDADLAISFSVGSQIWRPPPRNRYPNAISGDEGDIWTGYWAGATVEDVDYLEGQICVYVHDVGTGNTIWHGTVRDIRLESEDIFDEAVVEKILGKILAEFPPQ